MIKCFFLLKNSHFEDKDVATDTAVLITDLVVSGLDTAYSTHTGGPYNYVDAKIAEDIRFHNLHASISQCTKLRTLTFLSNVSMPIK